MCNATSKTRVDSPSITVVIVNYRTAPLVVECLRSLEHDAHQMPGLHVVLVDNASDDGSVETLRNARELHRWHDWVTFIEASCNRGFSAGCNIGIRTRHSTYYLLLNPDTTVQRGAIAALIDFMQSNPHVGIAGSCLESPEGAAQSTARRCPSPLSELDSGANIGVLSRLLHRWRIPIQDQCGSQPVQCDWVSGASMCVRKEVFDEIGLFDEKYFLYFEELDLCERARQSRCRWEVWSVPSSRIMHHEGASTGGLVRPDYWYDSRRRFFLMRYGVVGLLCADALWATGRAAAVVRGMVDGEHESTAPSIAARKLLWGDATAIFRAERLESAERREQA